TCALSLHDALPIYVWRAGRQTAVIGGHLQDCMHRADIDAVTTPRARRDERHFRRRAGRAEPALRRDALLGAPGNLVEHLPESLLKECAAVVQKLGSRLTCQRNAKRLSVPSA